MERRKNVVAAITAAVGLYLQSQPLVAAAEEPAPKRPEAPRPLTDAWAMSGRQSAMDMRRYLQLRFFK